MTMTMTYTDKLRHDLLDLVSDLEVYFKYQKLSGLNWFYLQKPESSSREHCPACLNDQETREDRLKQLRDELGDCRRCKLNTTRKNIVFGEGSAEARLVFVGEAPGADEDMQGRPFVGKAGQLLTKIINAINLKRADVYIANIIKCRPPQNRNPGDDEVRACIPFLKKQLKVIKPDIICTLGRIAAKALLETDRGITELRGTFYQFGDIKVMPTFHPSYLLRNPDKKRETWIDMQKVQKEYFKNSSE